MSSLYSLHFRKFPESVDEREAREFERQERMNKNEKYLLFYLYISLSLLILQIPTLSIVYLTALLKQDLT